MSWTDIFPIFSEEMLRKFRIEVKKKEREELDGWFGVERIARPVKRAATGRRARGEREHVVSATLFWKHILAADPELPIATLERLVMARRLGLVKRFAPWNSYVEPLLDYSAEAMGRNPKVNFRLYLANDLGFLLERFTNLGWEVHLMKSASLRYCPGGFWRFLALEETGKVHTVIDTDRMRYVDGDIARTEIMNELDLGLWRVPGYHSVDNEGKIDRLLYRPILGGHFGARGGVPIRELIEAFVWHTLHGTMPCEAKIPGRGDVAINRVKWPDYGCDEWFLLAVLYPRLVNQGTLSFIPENACSMLLPVDIEYVTWANPRSEIVYF